MSILYNHDCQLDSTTGHVLNAYTVWILAIRAQLTRRALSKILSLHSISINLNNLFPVKLTQSNQDVLHESYRRWHYVPKQKEYATTPYQSTSYLRSQSWGFLQCREEGRFLQHLWSRGGFCRLRVGLLVLWFWLRLSHRFVSHPTCASESAKVEARKVLYVPCGRGVLIAGTFDV